MPKDKKQETKTIKSEPKTAKPPIRETKEVKTQATPVKEMPQEHRHEQKMSASPITASATTTNSHEPKNQKTSSYPGQKFIMIASIIVFVILVLAIALTKNDNSVVTAPNASNETQPPVLAIEDRDYVTFDLNQCQTIRYVCQGGKVSFTNERGCGCASIKSPTQSAPVEETPSTQTQTQQPQTTTNSTNPTQPKLVTQYCTPQQRNATACTKEYNPVCGWFNQQVKCLKYPCAITAPNICNVCQNKDVEYYTQGACPSLDRPSTDVPTNSSLTSPTSPGQLQYIDQNKACTMEYMPVCVVLQDGQKITMGNSCTASNVKNVISTTPGECN